MGISLKLTSAIAIGGAIVKAGEVIEVSETEAKSLLHRGKAVLAVLDVPLTDEGNIDELEPDAEQPKAKSRRGK